MKTDKLELDPRILQKNLEITKLQTQVDRLTSESVYYQIKKAGMVFKPYMINVLNEIHELIIKMNKDVLTIQEKRKNSKDYKNINNLLTDLREIIKFMKS